MEQESDIKKAISKEQELYEFYVTLSKQSEALKFVRFFMKLALEELRHKRLLEMFLKSGDFQQAWDDAYKENILHTLLDPKDSYQQFNKQEFISAWKLAIKKEVEAYTLYLNLEKSASTDQLKKLFAQLKTWEISHKLYLEKKYKKTFNE